MTYTEKHIFNIDHIKEVIAKIIYSCLFFDIIIKYRFSFSYYLGRKLKHIDRQHIKRIFSSTGKKKENLGTTNKNKQKKIGTSIFS